MTDDVRKLLGGYATGTLTDAEKQVLYQAALDDGQLFEALADEQALKELLDDPAARAQLLQVVQSPRFSIGDSFREWFDRPRAKALVATGAVLLVAIAVTQVWNRSESYVATNIEHREIARVSPPGPVPPVPEAAESKPRQMARSTPKKLSAPATAPLADSVTRNQEKTTLVERPPEALIASAVTARQEQQGPVEAFAQKAKSGSTELRYVLRKRTESGDYVAVPITDSIGESDEARLSVQVNESGVVALTTDAGGPLSSALVESGRTFTFAIPAGSRTAALSFRRQPQQLVSNTLVPPAVDSSKREVRAKAAAPSGRSADVEAERSAGFVKAADTSAPLISVEIKLNRK